MTQFDNKRREKKNAIKYKWTKAKELKYLGSILGSDEKSHCEIE
jgi:hypothetical protein